jgi:hypothetical protein
MELLSVIRARAVWLLYLREINPRGKNTDAHIIEWLRNKYLFLKYPSSVYDRDASQALTFTGGSFYGHDGSSIGVDLSIYNDGLIADTRSSTKDADAFIQDVLSSIIKDFDLVCKPETLRKKLYTSELSVKPERPLNNANQKMQRFVRKVVSMMGDNNPGTLEFASLGFWWDPLSPNGQSHFQFERLVNTPFSEQRYYSRAPLHTHDHLQLLDEFEDLLLGYA